MRASGKHRVKDKGTGPPIESEDIGANRWLAEFHLAEAARSDQPDAIVLSQRKNLASIAGKATVLHRECEWRASTVVISAPPVLGGRRCWARRAGVHGIGMRVKHRGLRRECNDKSDC